ncbi:MAG: DNA-binding protein [Candidatus Aenigmarchaeota archaeon]|nr:DNA-binding protein [Candidatus Aenigmarchaeota archaeon]
MDQAYNENLKKQLELENLKKTILLNVLTKEARERLNNIRIVKPELANQIELYMVQLYQSGQISGKIDEDQLKKILNILQRKREFKIIRK